MTRIGLLDCVHGQCTNGIRHGPDLGRRVAHWEFVRGGSQHRQPPLQEFTNSGILPPVRFGIRAGYHCMLGHSGPPARARLPPEPCPARSPLALHP